MSKLSGFPDKLPDGSSREMDFYDSSFFEEPGKSLPIPSQVRALSKGRQFYPSNEHVVFKDSQLFVKFGPCVTTAEAQNLWMIKRVFGEEVPVPEVFGWRVDETNIVFIYMELIQGPSLLDRWNEFTDVDKISLRNHLSQITNSLRGLEQDPLDQFIGSISRQRVQDIFFEPCPGAGPFSTVREFNDWFSSLPQLWPYPSNGEKERARKDFPYSQNIKFTHANLDRANIIVSSSVPARILAIVDWEQSGWYPSYWEYCKALCACEYESDSEWRGNWIDEFLCPRMEDFKVFSEITLEMAVGRCSGSI